MPEINLIQVLSKTVWSPNLFSFRTTRPDGFRFDAGQFARLGVNPSELAHYTKEMLFNARLKGKPIPNEPIFRAYSIASSPYDEHLEFFSVVVPDGAFTSQLQHLAVGDSLYLESEPYGYLTLNRFQKPAPQDLWLLSTGTGLAPFLSMLQTLEVWDTYADIVLAYSVRTADDLAYAYGIDELAKSYQRLSEKSANFHFVPIITRQAYEGALSRVLNKRLPELLKSGELENTVGLKLSADTSHLMLCGNPDMVTDTKETLKAMGLTMNRRGEGNIAVENYW